MNAKHTDDDPIYFDHYDAEALHEILDTQHKIIEHTKRTIFKKLIQIFIASNLFNVFEIKLIFYCSGVVRVHFR